eukprot:scaffold3319_cov258-Pinguiococcus_pyrenoidosus.AAC.6
MFDVSTQPERGIHSKMNQQDGGSRPLHEAISVVLLNIESVLLLDHLLHLVYLIRRQERQEAIELLPRGAQGLEGERRLVRVHGVHLQGTPGRVEVVSDLREVLHCRAAFLTGLQHLAGLDIRRRHVEILLQLVVVQHHVHRELHVRALQIFEFAALDQALLLLSGLDHAQDPIERLRELLVRASGKSGYAHHQRPNRLHQLPPRHRAECGAAGQQAEQEEGGAERGHGARLADQRTLKSCVFPRNEARRLPPRDGNVWEA